MYAASLQSALKAGEKQAAAQGMGIGLMQLILCVPVVLLWETKRQPKATPHALAVAHGPSSLSKLDLVFNAALNRLYMEMRSCRTRSSISLAPTQPGQSAKQDAPSKFAYSCNIMSYVLLVAVCSDGNCA